MQVLAGHQTRPSGPQPLPDRVRPVDRACRQVIMRSTESASAGCASAELSPSSSMAAMASMPSAVARLAAAVPTPGSSRIRSSSFVSAPAQPARLTLHAYFIHRRIEAWAVVAGAHLRGYYLDYCLSQKHAKETQAVTDTGHGVPLPQGWTLQIDLTQGAGIAL